MVGQDIGASAGFAIVSLNAGYRPRKGFLVTAGVDNLFDRTYASSVQNVANGLSTTTGLPTTAAARASGTFTPTRPAAPPMAKPPISPAIITTVTRRISA